MRRLLSSHLAWQAVAILRRRQDVFLTTIVGLLSLGVYLLTLAPDVLDSDSGEFQHAPYSLGLPHPTGYPLYVIIGRLWTFLPLGSLAYRMNLLSAVFAALTIAGVYYLVRQIGVRAVASIAASLTLAVSPLFWSQSIIAEVYALNALLVIMVINLTVAARHATGKQQHRLIQALAITYGLGLAHHRTILFLLPGLAIYLWPILYNMRQEQRRLAGFAFLLVLPLAFYLYIPLRAPGLGIIGSIRWALGDSHLSNFGQQSPAQVLSRGLTGARMAIQQFSVFGVAAVLIGFVKTVRHDHRLAILIGLSGLSALLFYLVYWVSDADVFMLMAYLVAAIWLAVGIEEACTLVGRLIRTRSLPVAALFLMLPAGLLATNYAKLDLSDNHEVSRFWLELLSQPLEQGAMLIGDGWQLSPARYYQISEGIRTDIEVIGADMLTADGWQELIDCLDGGHTVYLLKQVSRSPAKFCFASKGSVVEMRPAPTELSAAHFPTLEQLEVDNIRLLGYSLDSFKVRAGETATVDLFWGVQDTPQTDFNTFVHIIDEQTGAMVAQQDKGALDYLYFGYASSHWPGGQTIRDRFQLSMPAELVPGIYRLEAGLYVLQGGQPVSVKRAKLGRIVVLSADNALSSGHPPLAVLGGRLRLLEAQVKAPPTLVPGQEIHVSLRWQAVRTMDEDYTVFVHLVDPSGKLVAQVDSLHLGGRYPTSLWDAGEVVVEERRLVIPGTLATGDYRLYAGAYTLRDQQRLTTEEGRDRVEIGVIESR